MINLRGKLIINFSLKTLDKIFKGSMKEEVDESHYKLLETSQICQTILQLHSLSLLSVSYFTYVKFII